VLCPYGRLQSALIDDHTLVIGYDAKRGEPRGRKGTPGAGDCVNCRRCVQVCPVGIDIRQGLQMECIGCAACVDACDTVMEKLHRPKGLVRYDSTNGLTGKPTKWIRPRIILYTALLLLGAAALTAGLSTLHSAVMILDRIPGAPYITDNGVVRNQFMLRVLNKRNDPVTYRIQLAGAPADLHTAGAESDLTIPALGETMRPIVFALPRANFSAVFPITVNVASADGHVIVEKTVPFVGPGY
jgi:cytochrome c oxidase accessory protein FixG